MTLDNAQNNPFQPNVLFRGFEASPLAGNAQGLAVYVNGRRQSFGDATRIPLSNHKEIALVIGRRPSRIPRTADFSQD